MKILNQLRADLYLKGDTDHEEGSLTQHLRWWARIMSIGRIPGITNQFLAFCRQSRYSLVITMMVMAQSLTDSYVSGTMFGFRACFRLLVQVSVHLDQHAKHKVKTQLEVTSRRCAKLVRFYEAYAWLTEGAVILALTIRKPFWNEFLAAQLQPLIGGRQDVLAQILRWGFLVAVQSVNGICCVVADYTFVVLILVVFLSLAVMFDAVSEYLESGPCNKMWAAQQSILTRVSLIMDDAVADLLPHLLIVSVVVPLFCTVEVVLNGLDADLFAVGMAPLVLAVFVPFCLVGEAMSEARQQLTDKAFAGPWLEEPVENKKLRLGILQMSNGNGGALRGRGVGYLDRETCASALKSWFSFLQVLMNLQ
ncbi:Odorant receptor coreceptor [Frankliniella fusca]|uniref:Odorant receptor coreceptor n=1 Tax=Frankliniella fusca TaxID=407009 RepID=A0AAE1L601_9NEOP|nr:Odorant receptor coreceptor [Frankliniella fusca]